MSASKEWSQYFESPPERRQDKVSEGSSWRLSHSSSNSPVLSQNGRELSSLDNPSPGRRSDTNTPKEADETVSSPLFPPISTHYSFLMVQFYRMTSTFLSFIFLTVVVFCAMIKTVSFAAYVLWCWLRLTNPNHLRPFIKQEEERKHINTGKLMCDVGYYARQVGLDCEETKIETEDGFILTIQHIVDRRPGSVDSKRNSTQGLN